MIIPAQSPRSTLRSETLETTNNYRSAKRGDPGGHRNTYDNSGNTLTGGGRTNTWDSENRMVKSVAGANTSFYTYAADGLRHRSVVNSNTTDYAYDADMFVREIGGGTNLATYLAGPIGPMYRRDDVGGTVKWYRSEAETPDFERGCYDALGSVLAEVDNTGTITASRAFDVYGSVRNSTGTSTSKHKFVGQLGHTSDDETGLTYMRARYMDPATGTFVTEDPQHSGMNWYMYCHWRAVTGRDRSGRDDLGEELSAEAGEESLEAELDIDVDALLQDMRADADPEKLNGFTNHGMQRFMERFEKFFGRDATVKDGIDLLSKWNPGKAFIGS